ncbi:EsV-1-45 [Ectocarpus siliculosus]|uniref:EsV-1-45 n=1 Tax=Ectocarpus siliculosus TaxID=2880 RepID=D8LP78_ECTSI|nr:EsV-1-45 [Ectocarpus siliculosus]|eukprot:CBN80349.1 EsV-1-45 [Ectocarpus siliculosus]
MLKWLRDKDFINNSDMTTTQTVMTGGVVSVPDENYDEFLQLYAEEVRSKNKTLSFSELRSDPVFCMYFDVDMLGTGVLGAAESSRIFSVIQSVIRSYYTGDQNDDRFRCVVCDTSVKKVPSADGETMLTKNGYHAIFPNLRINLSQALQLRYSVVYELEKTLGPRTGSLNPWSDVIDKAPYTGGLKMCGSFKRVKCTDCKKTDPTFKDKKKALLSEMAKLRKKIYPRQPGFDYTDLSDIHSDEFKDAVFGDKYGKYLDLTGFNSCKMCLNTGKVMEKRTYMPCLVLDGGGDVDVSLLDVLREDYFEVMKYTSIRCQEGEKETSGFTIPKGVPRAPTEENGANMRTFSSKSLTHLGSDMHAFTVNNDIYLSDAQTMRLWKGPRVEDARRLSVIETFLRNNVCSAYSSVQIRKVSESTIKKVAQKPNGGSKMMNALIRAHAGTTPPSPDVALSNRYLVNVAGVGSTFCMNKGSEHASNSVYFIITATQCFQRCFSKKPEIRRGGTTCAEYRSYGFAVPPSVSAVLFPGEAVKTPAIASLAMCPDPKNRGKKKRRRMEWGNKKL